MSKNIFAFPYNEISLLFKRENFLERCPIIEIPREKEEEEEEDCERDWSDIISQIPFDVFPLL